MISNANAESIPRIQAKRVNRGEVEKIYLAPGLGSMVIFPCLLQEIFIGRSDDLKAQISPSDKKVLLLNLTLNSSLPTNLIAKCEGTRLVSVFDIIPSRSLHQDVIEIRSAFGRPIRLDGQVQVKNEDFESKKVILKKRLFVRGSQK